MKYTQYVIAVASLMGIVTALTVGLFSASRIVMSAARDWQVQAHVLPGEGRRWHLRP